MLPNDSVALIPSALCPPPVTPLWDTNTVVDSGSLLLCVVFVLSLLHLLVLTCVCTVMDMCVFVDSLVCGACVVAAWGVRSLRSVTRDNIVAGENERAPAY